MIAAEKQKLKFSRRAEEATPKDSNDHGNPPAKHGTQWRSHQRGAPGNLIRPNCQLDRHAAPHSRRMNAPIGVGTEKVKAKNTIKNQVSLLEENSRKLFSKSFRKHMITTAKAKKESKEVYRKSRVNNSDKSLLERAPHYRRRIGGTSCIIHNVEEQCT